MLLQQRCEGPNGSAVSNANAVSPNQWDGVTVSGTGSSMTYANLRAIHDNLTSINIHMAAVASSNYTRWSAAIGSSLANIYMRFYAYFTATPSSQMRLATMLSTGAASSALAFATGGKLRTLNGAGATVATSTNDIPLNKWVRIEYDCLNISGTTGTLNGRFYSGANLEGSTPDTGGSISTAGAAIAGLVNDARLGTSAATTMTSVWDMWASDVAVSDSPIGALPFRGWGVPM